MSKRFLILDSIDFRIMRSNEIAVVKHDSDFYEAESQTTDGKRYMVERINGEWICTCPDSRYREIKCKHVYAVEQVEALNGETSKSSDVKREPVIQWVNWEGV